MSENKNKPKLIPLIITVIIILAVSIAYFTLGNQNKGVMTNSDPAIYEDLKLKAVYADTGEVKIFALAKNNALAMYETREGESIPEINTVVIGFEEAAMMREEKLFSKPGDTIQDLFGIDVTIGGILEKTSSPIDDFHFVSESNFNKVKGDDNTLFVKLDAEEIPKLFYSYPYDMNTPLKFKLEEGNISSYAQHEILSETYYPLIIGSKEAKMMREEKLFSKPGDTIQDLFGNNFVVVGILAETNTSLDMMHLTPLTPSELI
ncbi:MAG: hypothetical protein ACP5N2_07160 [Candidatus Nanoarchaeia archaeon]